jgi:mono/diheme cytochrome c family protein
MRRFVVTLAVVLVLLTALVVVMNFRDESSTTDSTAQAPPGVSAAQVERGEYLVKMGNCGGCHTDTGGEPFAGGRGIDTPFGPVFASNITPDSTTGIGNWSPAEFWRAMHNGRSRDGRLLYPVFPYPNYTKVKREDSDAIFAYLRTLPAVQLRNRTHALRFPYDTQAALALWRVLYFRPGQFVPDTSRSLAWNRGAYLVEGLGHCNACHGSRNVLGATTGPLDLGGGLIPMQNWYAPSLLNPHEASVAAWDEQEIVDLLRRGVSTRAVVTGPMADVVWRSTQHLADDDARAIAAFLKALPAIPVPPAQPATPLDPAVQQRGADIYGKQCAECHGDQGEGVRGIYPALAGNRQVMLDPPANIVRVVAGGGFAPATAGNPRPFGMPPFAIVLNDADIGAVITYVRNAWGNAAPAVGAFEVNKYRE